MFKLSVCYYVLIDWRNKKKIRIFYSNIEYRIYYSNTIWYSFVRIFVYILNYVFCFSVVVIKRGPVVEADKNFTSQLRLMNLSDGSPYETLHSIVSNAVAPYFKSFLRVTGKADR